MNLTEYAQQQGHGALARIARRSGVSYTTVRFAAGGNPIKRYEVAKRISDATDGVVTVDDLCAESTDAGEAEVSP